eukprot:TRINITY_DN15393_c0_g1_i3.p1 TRINITY_DN15393_c0_g1~~TRINITY_DN15393_c0_g1_i3.p1  ORF type:complete len:113 (-),score=12.85 TRINITY_DN15393_c0_g1_i3:171-509(-)
MERNRNARVPEVCRKDDARKLIVLKLSLSGGADDLRVGASIRNRRHILGDRANSLQIGSCFFCFAEFVSEAFQALLTSWCVTTSRADGGTARNKYMFFSLAVLASFSSCIVS